MSRILTVRYTLRSTLCLRDDSNMIASVPWSGSVTEAGILWSGFLWSKILWSDFVVTDFVVTILWSGHDFVLRPRIFDHES